MAVTKHWLDIPGVIGSSFTIGYGAHNATFTVNVVTDDVGNEKIQLKLNRALDLGDLPIVTTYDASNPEDLCTLKITMERLNATENAIYTYIDEKIRELTGGTTGGNVMLSPLLFEVSNAPEGDGKFGFGSLSINKFLDRIIFEVETPFHVVDPKTLYFSIGTSDSSKEDIVPKFGTDLLQSTRIVTIAKTLKANSDFYLFTYLDTGEEPPEPEGPDYDPEFVQSLINKHETVQGEINSDADGDIVDVRLSGTDLTGEVLSTETFGTVEGNYMDFAVTVPLKASGVTRYRIVQHNPALSIYDGKDEYVSNQDGTWVKDRTYEIADDAGPSLDYEFLLGESSGDADYVHLYIYDLDAEDPDQIIRTYHIKNELHFAAASAEALLLEPANGITMKDLQDSIFFAGIDEASMGLLLSEDGASATVTLSGQITRPIETIGESFPWLQDKLNVTLLNIDYAASDDFKFRIFDPAFDGMETILDYVYTTDEGQAYCEGVVRAANVASDSVTLQIPITPNKAYPIQVQIIDPATNEVTLTVHVNNLLTFDVKESTVDNTVRGELLEDFNLAASGTGEIPTDDQGSMRIRILSF